MRNATVIEIDRDEIAVRIINAAIFPDTLKQLGTATETLNMLGQEQSHAARNAADVSIGYLYECLNKGHTKH